MSPEHPVLALFGPENSPTQKNRSPLAATVKAQLAKRQIILRGEYNFTIKVSARYTFGCGKGLHHPDWEASLTNLTNGRGCPQCAVTSPPTAKVRVDLAKRQIILRGEHRLTIKTHAHYTFGCAKELEHPDWKAALANVRAGSGCPSCAGKASPLTIEVQAELKPRQIILRGTHGFTLKTNIPYTFGCEKGFGHKDWAAKLNNVRRGTNCPSCAKIVRLSKKASPV